jgi:hypothetical protein
MARQKTRSGRPGRAQRISCRVEMVAEVSVAVMN